MTNTICSLTLTRPLIFFDTETTGTDKVKDRIIELSTCKISPEGTQEVKTARFNPGITIPLEATMVHGITNEDVKDKPPFSKYAQSISDYFKGSDIGGYNCIGFDVPILVEELLRAKAPLPFDESTKFVDAMRIFHLMEKRDLSAALKFYCGKDHDSAHSAEADVLASAEVLNAQVTRYGFKGDLTELHDFCNENTSIVDYDRKFTRNQDGEIIFNFGKNYGKKVSADPDYLNWMLSADFSNHTKYCIKKILSGDLA